MDVVDITQRRWNFCCLCVEGLITEVISYCAGVAVLRFQNDHSGVTCEADFPIGYVRGDGQRQVERSPEPRTVRRDRSADVEQLQFVQLGDKTEDVLINSTTKQKQVFFTSFCSLVKLKVLHVFVA